MRELKEATESAARAPRYLADDVTPEALAVLLHEHGERMALWAPEGGELVMEASLAIKYKIPVSALAEAFHPYLTMSEAIKLAAITFQKDVNKLSCCAS